MSTVDVSYTPTLLEKTFQEAPFTQVIVSGDVFKDKTNLERIEYRLKINEEKMKAESVVKISSVSLSLFQDGEVWIWATFVGENSLQGTLIKELNNSKITAEIYCHRLGNVTIGTCSNSGKMKNGDGKNGLENVKKMANLLMNNKTFVEWARRQENPQEFFSAKYSKEYCGGSKATVSLSSKTIGTALASEPLKDKTLFRAFEKIIEGGRWKEQPPKVSLSTSSSVENFQIYLSGGRDSFSC